jgi:hypothetical protein
VHFGQRLEKKTMEKLISHSDVVVETLVCPADVNAMDKDERHISRRPEVLET